MDVLTAPQMAKLCNQNGVPITRQHITRLCRSGEINAQLIGKQWLIPRSEANDFIEKKKSETMFQ